MHCEEWYPILVSIGNRKFTTGNTVDIPKYWYLKIYVH